PRIRAPPTSTFSPYTTLFRSLFEKVPRLKVSYPIPDILSLLQEILPRIRVRFCFDHPVIHRFCCLVIGLLVTWLLAVELSVGGRGGHFDCKLPLPTDHRPTSLHKIPDQTLN